MPKFVVLSPDGLPIHPRTFKTRARAEAELAEWCQRFEPQGYYSGVTQRIALKDLPAHCRIKEVPPGGDIASVAIEPDEPPAVDDSISICPDCERPNQFGELCPSCQRDREIEAQQNQL